MPRSTASSRLKKTASRSSLKSFSPLTLLALFIVGAVFGVWVLKMLGWHIFIDARHKVQFSQVAPISGTVHYTALKPDPGDKGGVQLVVREVGQTEWQNTDVKIALKPNEAWQWSDALPGNNYEFQAILVIDGKEVKKSEIVLATAPAHNVELPLEVNWKDLPEDVVAVSSTKLAGQVVINGYIPSSAVLEIYALNPKHYQGELYQVSPEVLREATMLDSIVKPQPTTTWEWDKAVPLESYMVVAVLKNQGQIIGISEQLILADASEEALEQVINSTAQPPKDAQTSVLGASTLLADAMAQAVNPAGGKSVITGTVYIQGPKQKDTSLLMLWRQPGQSDYQVVNRYMYPEQQGTNWQWNQAVAGQQYQIMAALQVDGNNTSTAPNPTTVTAPANLVNFTLNTYYVIPATTSQPVNEVCVDSNGNQSTAIIRLPQIANAAQYWVQVGQNTGQAGVYNQKMPASPGQDLKVRVRVQNNQQNFVRYTYATCVNCQSDQNFAPFSQEVGFTCSS